MSLRTRNKISAQFSMSSLTDIIFLLLIFFMLTSTLVSPNALKLLLPSSSSQTLAKQTVSVSISADLKYYVGRQQVEFAELASVLQLQTAGTEESTVVLNAEKSVPIEEVVKVMDIARNHGLKMILATQPSN